MNTNQSAAELAISRARAALILDQPFFGTLALRLRPTAGGCKTMATDGRSLFFNPAWVEKQKPAELVGVIAHEVMHCAMSHHCRRGARDPRKWNIAADHAINPILVDAGFTLPAGGLNDPAYHGLAAEQIFGRLPHDPPGGGGNGPGGAPGGLGQGEPAPGEVWDAPAADGAPTPSPADLAQAENDWKVAVLQAAQSAKAAGDRCPGFARDLAAKIRAPEIDWRDALRRYLSAVAHADYSWSRPNVRHLATGDYLPSLHSESLGEVLVAIDTSGSITGDELAAFTAEVNAILEDTRPERVHAVYCHAAVYKAEEFAPEDYPVAFSGLQSGGTAFAPVWDWARENSVEPVCAIFLTDCQGPFGDDPGFPVLWVSTMQAIPPYGEVVRLRGAEG